MEDGDEWVEYDDYCSYDNESYMLFEKYRKEYDMKNKHVSLNCKANKYGLLEILSEYCKRGGEEINIDCHCHMLMTLKEAYRNPCTCKCIECIDYKLLQGIVETFKSLSSEEFINEQILYCNKKIEEKSMIASEEYKKEDELKNKHEEEKLKIKQEEFVHWRKKQDAINKQREVEKDNIDKFMKDNWTSIEVKPGIYKFKE